MKVERQIKSPNLFGFAETALPPSLVAGSVIEGYGRGYYIWAGSKPWFGRGTPVAEIEGTTIRLFETNYFSDMERLALAYEEATGHEIMLTYWQSPKDNPL